MSLDFFTACDIEEGIGRIETLLATNIFSPEYMGHPFVKSAFIEVLVCLRDLTWKSKEFASRISFTDDIIIVPKDPTNRRDRGVQDITDLITLIRDAVCHLDLYTQYLIPQRMKATFSVTYGKGRLLPPPSPSSDYDDDVCFMFGIHRIYLKRHIIRAFEEAKQNLKPLL